MVTLSNTQQTRQTRYGLFKLLGAVILLTIPILVFWYVWSTYAVNVPKWDDHALRQFLFNLDNQTSVSGKLFEFFRQHNEHRIVFDRFITWLDFNLFGKFSYRHLMVIGNLSLLGLVVIFGLVIGRSIGTQTKNTKSKPEDYVLYLPPVAFLLLNLSQWENMFWGMAALQNFTVLMWVFWTIYLLAFTERIWPAFLLGLIATLTSGNGLLIWPVGLGILVLQLVLEKRPNRNAILIWTAGAICIIALYFLDYKKPPGNPPATGGFIDLIKGWLAFNGSAVEAFPVGRAFANCLIAGSIATVLVLGSWVYMLEKGLVQKRFPAFSYFFVGTTAFLLGTAATVAWSRVGFGLHLLITSRYKIYSLLLLALIYSFVIIQQRKTGRLWAAGFGLVFSGLLMGGSYLTYLGDTIWWNNWLVTKQFNWTHNANNATITLDSVSKRYTTLAPAFYDAALPTMFDTTYQSVVDLNVTKVQGDYELQNGTIPFQGSGDAGVFVLARSDRRTYLFPVRQNQQSARKARFLPMNLFTDGFRSTISLSADDLVAGTYRLFVLTVSDGKNTLYPTNQRIESAGPSSTTLPKNW
ncbi:hypothetical protein [Spirosoma sp. KNUC1025]|uniref:hypothetical protein n=1 Tax=Spirosoma sp. KNUC1025 TaxID=2894082 RepID=UPI00386EF46B|nr:hypothetical protein LN737_16365 [Spirosoma sp. KNUC1025]